MRTCSTLVALLLSVAPEGSAQSSGPSARVPAAALQADVLILRQAMEALHPGLLRYNTSTQMNARFDSLAAELGREQTLAEAYLAIARFAGKIECGHTFPNPYNQEGRVREAIVVGGGRVPFYFRWLDGRMIVTRNLSSDAALVPGTEVIAINGVSSAEILQRLLPLSRADGSNDAKRVANLEVIEGERYSAFDTYFPLVFPPPAGAWRFSLQAPDGTARSVSLEAVPDSVRGAIADSVGNAGQDSLAPPWTLRQLAGGIAVLAMPTWVTYKNNWDWQGFIHRAFAELAARGTPNLVIDLRGNEGGTSVGEVILQHLIDAPLALSASERFTRYQRIPPGLKPYLDTWDRSFDDWGTAAVPSSSRPGFYRMTKYDDGPAGTIIQPAAPRYLGKVWVLVGPENSSATFEFALDVKQNHLAILVGRPTGGNQRGINGGAFYFLRLPNSGIEVDLPLIAQFPVTPEPDAGIAPDVLAVPTAQDIAAGVDAELGAVLAMVHGPRAELYLALAGRWDGTLEYKDYRKPDQRVTLPTTLGVTWSADSSALEMRFVYDDGPGKIVREADAFGADSTMTVVHWGGVDDSLPQRFAVVSRQAGPAGLVLVLEAMGRDDDAPALIRETFTVTPTTLTILKETRPEGGALGFRHVYRFKRA